VFHVAIDVQSLPHDLEFAVVEGRLRIHAGGQPWAVGAGELIALADNLREPITALEETAFILTVAWPPR
jgi:quercetin dioxygenase-like cupin family protein